MGEGTIYEVGDIHTLTVISDEELYEGMVFRSRGGTPEQEYLFWEVQNVRENRVCECKVVGINEYAARAV